MYLSLYSVLIFLFGLNNVVAVNVLGIFTIPIKSWHILGYDLLVALASRGYNVTLISSFPVENKITNFSHVLIEGTIALKEEHRDIIQGESKLGFFGALNFIPKLVNIEMKSKGFQNFLKTDSHFDIIIQAYISNEAYLGLAHRFNSRVIAYIPGNGLPVMNDLAGNSGSYANVPIPFLSFTDNMTFLQRTVNTITGNFMTLLQKFYLLPQQEALLKKHFPDAPPLYQIEQDRVDLVFTNAHFSYESPRPFTPNMIYIGGYHVQETGQLPPELKKYLDAAKEGVIFFSFGTNVEPSKFPKDKLDSFLNKLGKVPHKVLFKYGGELKNKPKNIETSSWYPQKAILAHPNTRAFIAHGGRGGTTEALRFGIPTLCISFYGDQKKNCADIVGYGYGIHLPYAEVTQETFEAALDELLGNHQYRDNATFRAALFNEHEINPLDRAVFWIEHILKFKGAKHLKPKAATMPLYQYLLLDVYAFLFTLIGIAIFVCYKSVKLMLLYVFKKYKNVYSINKRKEE